jgi:hypothetical protein
MRPGHALLLMIAFSGCEEPNDPARVIPIDEYRESQGLPPLPDPPEETSPPPGPALWHRAETIDPSQVEAEGVGDVVEDPGEEAAPPGEQPELTPAERAQERRAERARESFRDSIEAAEEQAPRMLSEP